MAGYFELTLDTTPPEGITVSLNNGEKYAETPNVSIKVGTSDKSTAGYQMKVWGDFDSSASSEETAKWKDYSESDSISLSGDDGQKYIYVMLMDDLGNVSAVYSSKIRLNTSGEAIVEMADYYGYDGIRDGATFLLDDSTRTALGYELRELIGKAVTLTGDCVVGFGKPGNVPLGFVQHIGLESNWGENYVVSVIWNTAQWIESGKLQPNDFLVCDGNGGLMKSGSYTNAKIWGEKDGFAYAYICG